MIKSTFDQLFQSQFESWNANGCDIKNVEINHFNWIELKNQRKRLKIG